MHIWWRTPCCKKYKVCCCLQDGIRMNSVKPGYVETPLIKASIPPRIHLLNTFLLHTSAFSSVLPEEPPQQISEEASRLPWTILCIEASTFYWRTSLHDVFMMQHLLEDEVRVAMIKSRTPMRRWAQPQEVAGIFPFSDIWQFAWLLSWPSCNWNMPYV